MCQSRSEVSMLITQEQYSLHLGHIHSAESRRKFIEFRVVNDETLTNLGHILGLTSEKLTAEDVYRAAWFYDEDVTIQEWAQGMLRTMGIDVSDKSDSVAEAEATENAMPHVPKDAPQPVSGDLASLSDTAGTSAAAPSHPIENLVDGKARTMHNILQQIKPVLLRRESSW